jgi:hypothetical protein
VQQRFLHDPRWPRRIQRLHRSCSNLKQSNGVWWWPGSTVGTSPRTQARRCWDRSTEAPGWCVGVPTASSIAATPRYGEHKVETLVGQCIFGLALGYEDLNDHDELRTDPTFAVLAGKLSPVLRTDCEPWLARARSIAWSTRPGAPAPRVEVSPDRLRFSSGLMRC